MTDKKKEYQFQFGAMGESLWTSEKFPMVKFFKKGPASKDDCYFCDSSAIFVADLGTQERRCCDNPNCMDRAAEVVWKFICWEAEEEGFTANEQGIHDYLVSKNNEMKDIVSKGLENAFKQMMSRRHSNSS